jgi:hypothetical protein
MGPLIKERAAGKKEYVSGRQIGGSTAGRIPKLRTELAVLLVNELGISYAEIAPVSVFQPLVSQ